MEYLYRITPLAVSDIDDALDYISGTLLNPEAAANLFSSMQSEILRICDNPYAFPDCSHYLIDDNNIRHSVIGRHVLIFEVSESEKIVKILRFLYGARDITHTPISSSTQ